MPSNTGRKMHNTMPETMTFGRWLKQLRTAHDLTQDALAEQVGCAGQTIRMFESGARRPSRGMAERLAEILAIPVAERTAFVRHARTKGIEPSSTQETVALQPPEARPAVPTGPVNVGRARPVALPLAANVLIGRELEHETVSAVLLDPATRLVTLLGAGGIGKTRLALQIATDLASHFADGVAWIPLASVTQTEHLPTAVADALNLTLQGAESPMDQVIKALRDRQMLLVLDNFEHLLPAVTFPEQILAHAPHVKILATTRERLRMAGEWVIELHGLPLPEEQPMPNPRSTAALLFLERARQVDHAFALTPANQMAVDRICRLLGGLPLGIELAAAWVRVLPPEEIAKEIERSLDFLDRPDRTTPQRHSSLRTLFDHSWHLLTEQERDMLMRLSVFKGGCRRDAVSAVLDNRVGAPTVNQALPGSGPGSATLQLLAALVDKSLVRRVTDAQGATRYDLHELVRQYAAARLAAHSALQVATQAQHAAFYASWVAQQERVLKSARQRQAVQTISAEIDNVRAAWQWACEHHDGTLLRQMLLTMDWFYEIRGWYDEGAASFAQGHTAIAVDANHPTASADLQSCYWLMLGREGWHIFRHDPARALHQLQTAVDQLRRVSRAGEHGHCIKGLAYLKTFAGDYVAAADLLNEGRSLTVAYNDPWQQAIIAVVRAVLEVLRSDPITARRYLEESLSAARICGDPRNITLSLNYLGQTALSLGQIAEAEQACRECLALATESQDRSQISLALLSLGQVALSRDDTTTSARLFEEGLALARELNDRWMEAQALASLGTLAAHSDDRIRARTLVRAAVAAAAGAPVPLALDPLQCLAVLEQDAQSDAALTVWAYIMRHPRTRPATRKDAEKCWATAEHSIAVERLQQAKQTAQTFPPDRPTDLLALFR